MVNSNIYNQNSVLDTIEDALHEAFNSGQESGYKDGYRDGHKVGSIAMQHLAEKAGATDQTG